jgi:hypothetical protein
MMTQRNKRNSGRKLRPQGTASGINFTSDSSNRQGNFSPRCLDTHRAGMAMIWVAIFLLLMVLLLGLSLDSAKAFLVAHQIQNAADAAALAGACVITVDPSYARAVALATARENLADADEVELVDNPSNLPDGDVVLGWYSRMFRKFVPAFEKLNAVKVVARRTGDSPGGPVPLVFGPVAGVDNIDVRRYAIAMTHGGTGAGVIALSPGEPPDPSAPKETGLLINGNVTLDVNDGMIQVNSNIPKAVVFKGSSITLSAEELNLCGDIVAPAFDLGALDFPIDDDAPALPDPLCPKPEACTPPPTWDPAADLSGGDTLTISTGTHVLEPGYYSGGFYITGGDVTLKPGIYVLGGGPHEKGGLVIGGNANFCAKGVMFYITEKGKVDLAGGGPEDCYIRVTPPDPESTDFCGADFSYPAGFDFATYSGISIFQDRTNEKPASIVGTSLLDLDGTLYFPRAHVDLTGTGDGFGNQLIAWTIEISGNSNITINYRGKEPLPTRKSFLVE